MGTLISATCTVFCTMSSPSTLISTIYPHRKFHLHTLDIPHYVRQWSFSELNSIESTESIEIVKKEF